MVERRVSWEFIFVALVLTGAVMGGVFFMGVALSQEKVSTIQHDVERLSISQRSQELSRQLADTLPGDSCRAMELAVDQTADDVQALQEQVARYERSQKIRNGEFELLKQRYTNVLVEYYLTVDRVDERCTNTTTVEVLYLYHGERCSTCEEQGILLTDKLQQYDDRLVVFPLDASLGVDPVDLLVETYNVTSYPTLIVEGEVHRGFQDREALDRIIQSELDGNATGVSG